MAELLAADGLARLVAMGFVRAEGYATIVMHRLVANYIWATLPDEGAQTAVEQQVIEIITELLMGTWALAIQKFPPVHLRYIMEQALACKDANSARLVNLWARYLRDIGDYANAEQKLLDAQKLQHHSLVPDHPVTVESLFQLGRLYIRMGRYEESRDHYEQYLAYWEQASSPNMVKIAKVLHALGTLHMGLGNFELASVYGNLGKIYLGLDDLEEAWAYSVKALNIRERVLGRDHLETAFSLNNLGRIFRRQARYDEALPYFERALKIRETTLQPDHPHLADSLQQMGKLLLQTGDRRKAVSYLQRALIIRDSALEMNHPKTAGVLIDLGEWYQAEGDHQVAHSHFERARAMLAGRVAATHHELKRVRQHLQPMRRKGKRTV